MVKCTESRNRTAQPRAQPRKMSQRLRLIVALLGLTLWAAGVSAADTEADQESQVVDPAVADPGQSQPVQEQDESIQLKPITVEGKAETIDGYQARRSATATKTDTLIIDIPASVQVIPREVIEDQNAINVADVVRNVSGVQNAGTAGNRSGNFTIRGFSSSRLAIDGFLTAASFGNVGFLDLANIERVEVLKGPASVLYGRINPGGLINLVTEKPQPEPFTRADLTYGSYDFKRAEIDVNRPVTDDDSLLFRVSAAYQAADSFRDSFTDSDRTLLAPSLRWVLSPDTTLDVQIALYDQEQPFDRGLVAIGDRAGVLPRDRYLGERFSQYQAEALRFSAALDHWFNDTWRMRSMLRAADTEAHRFSADPRGLQEDGRTLNRRVADLDQFIRNYAFQNNLIGTFDNGFIGHKVLIGLDANFTRFESDFRTAPLAPIDVFNPIYGARPGAFGPVSTQDRALDSYGFYLQDLISFGEHWKLLLGARYDYAITKFARDDQRITDATDQELSPRAGIVFQPIRNVSLYASYTQSFQPPVFARSADGSPFEPLYGQQVEAGVKRVWLQGRLSTTLAVFELTRQNVFTDDPDNPGFSIQTGEQRSRGVELDISGELLPGWQLIASAAYLDTAITQDNVFEEGNRLPNAPEWSGSLWSTYTFQGGLLRGLELGGGIFAVGRRVGDLSNSFEASGYGRVDAFVQYPFNDNLQLSLNANNLFDADYIKAVSGRNAVYPGAPRSVFVELELQF